MQAKTCFAASIHVYPCQRRCMPQQGCRTKHTPILLEPNPPRYICPISSIRRLRRGRFGYTNKHAPAVSTAREKNGKSFRAPSLKFSRNFFCGFRSCSSPDTCNELRKAIFKYPQTGFGTFVKFCGCGLTARGRKRPLSILGRFSRFPGAHPIQPIGLRPAYLRGPLTFFQPKALSEQYAGMSSPL
jgi:hypothetical protein